MKYPKLYCVRSARLPVLIFSIAWLISGCSSSSESDALDAQSPIISTVPEATNSEGASNESLNTTIASGETEITNDAMVVDDANTTTTETNPPAVADPLIQNTIQVNFEITVPAYQSNELQVQLVWGELNLSAMWVGDELWSASAELPTETENVLTVTFFDRNGEIELAGFSQAYKTGFNAAESFQINADQFNSDQWDTDEDGVSNLNELIAGTDPLVNEYALLEMRDTTPLVYLGFAADYFESRIPMERPYYEFSKEQPEYHEGGRPPTGAAQTIEINIDESGNGTLSDTRQEGFGIWLVRTTFTGTRTHSDNAIQWEATRVKYEDPISLSDTTSTVNTISVVDERTRQYEETYSHTYNPSDSDILTVDKIETDLTGEMMDGTSLCQPVAGSIIGEKTYGGRAESNQRTKTTSITKDADDQYWRVKIVETGNEPVETEYLARNFDSTFQCVFTDLE